MFVRVAACGLLALLSGCHRVLRETKIEGQIDTGVLVDFGEGDGRALSWDFGDGTARAGTQQARHAFLKPGRYLVQGYEGERLAERVEIVVVSRALVRAVPEDAEALVWTPSLKEDLGPTVDFFERVAGPGNALRWLEQAWLPALAVELSMGDGSVVDPQEGVGLMMLPGFPGQIALLGVVDADRAVQALAQKLAQAGAEEDPKTDDGIRLFVAPWGSAAAFVDRGYLYLVLPEPEVDAHQVLKAVGRVRSSGLLGLQAYPPFAESYAALGNANLCLYARDNRQVPKGARPPLLQSVVAGVRVGTVSATLEGTVRTSRPLERTAGAGSMFARAAEGPVAALKLSLPPEELADLALGQANNGSRGSLLRKLEVAGIDTTASINAFTGEVGVLAWFDAEGFLKNLVGGTGKPDWRGVVHLIAGLTTREPVAPLLTRLLGEAVRAPYADDRDALLWQWRLASATATIALTPRALMIRSGDGSGPRANADLSRELGERFKGAFGPGHSSLLVDLGRLKRELDTPRVIPGLDPSKVVTSQGFSSAFLDHLTPIDHVVLDFEPRGNGGRLWGMIRLKER
ncbi:MAG: putative lipoprotein [Myxococcaceae bacterium]|nr:putative lipoprotein [Myxococcaceae bacterium]